MILVRCPGEHHLFDREMKNNPSKPPLRAHKGRCVRQLLANSKSLDNNTISIDVLGLQVVKKAPTLTHHSQQAAAGVVVFCVSFEVVG